MFLGTRMLVWLPLPSGSTRIIAPIPPLEIAPKDPSMDFVQKLIHDRGAGDEAQVMDIVWGSHTRVRSRIADKFYMVRDGNGEKTGKGGVMLIGDAAHIHSPAGGQGMNLGLRDAVALGLSIHLDMSGNPDALERWAANRQRVAANILKMTDALVWAGTRTGLLGFLRNCALRIAGMFPAFGRRAAYKLSGLSIDK
jgi:2-polyprenyl-6-methoxyphenol hydroxylase-like FAD-dependent oxidoreductase